MVKLRWWEKIYYPIWRKWDFLINIPKEIKWFCQRGYRGWADCDIWSLDGYLSSWMPDALRRLGEKKVGCPGDLYDEANKDDECRKWKEVLEKIARGFEANRENGDLIWFKPNNGKKHCDFKTENGQIVNVDGCEYVEDKELREKLEAETKEGMELFIKYYGNLWD